MKKKKDRSFMSI